jgi:two-component system, probable response regulator PhcQ
MIPDFAVEQNATASRDYSTLRDETSETKPAVRGARTVLLVDDDNNTLRALARVLHNQPYQIYTARSGDEAKFVLKTHAVDLIVADDQMPGMSGIDLLAWVAGKYPNIARIMLTGQATTERVIRAINESQVHRYFVKPCNEFQLAVAINNALEGKNWPSEK